MNPEQKKAVGKELRKLREQKNWTQEHLVGAAEDVSLRSIQRAERGDGIGKENLANLADAFDVDVQDLLRNAQLAKDSSPELRLKLRRLENGEQLIQMLRKQGNLITAPPGEHPYNEHIAYRFIELQREIEKGHDKPAINKKLRRDTTHLLKSSEQLGFGVFAAHYCEEYKRPNKVVRKPTTLIIAATHHDERIEKTPKGLVLDYIMDSRRQPLANLLNGCSTLFDWMQDQLISKSDGPERVATVRRVLHDQTSAQTKQRKAC